MSVMPSNVNPPAVIPPMLSSAPEGASGNLALPPEVSLAEAARIANCDKKTVIRYLRDGVLQWRNIAPPSSSRPTYRIRLDTVLAIRTTYRSGHSHTGLKSDPHETRRSNPTVNDQRPVLKHVRLHRG
jgi:hypothetical protein